MNGGFYVSYILPLNYKTEFSYTYRLLIAIVRMQISFSSLASGTLNIHLPVYGKNKNSYF